MSHYIRWFCEVFLLTLGLLALGGCVALLIRRLRQRTGAVLPPIRPRRALLTFALCGDILMTLVLTFFERSYTISAIQPVPFAGLIEGEYTLFFLNIGVFIPFGVLLPLRFPCLRRVSLTAACSCGFSLLIELLQLIFRRGVCDIDDLICNTLGGLIGSALACFFLRIFKSTFRR